MRTKMPRSITTDPLASAHFARLLDTDGPEAALVYARNAGLRVERHHVPTPALDRYRALAADDHEKAKAFRAFNHAAIAVESAAEHLLGELTQRWALEEQNAGPREKAERIAEKAAPDWHTRSAEQKATAIDAVAATLPGTKIQPIDPLLGLSRAEKVRAIVAGNSGLAPLDAFDALRTIGAHEEAQRYRGANFRAIESAQAERIQRAEAERNATAAIDAARREKLAPVVAQAREHAERAFAEYERGIATKYTDARGEVLREAKGYQDEIAALRGSIAADYQRTISEATAKIEAEIAPPGAA